MAMACAAQPVPNTTTRRPLRSAVSGLSQAGKRVKCSTASSAVLLSSSTALEMSSARLFRLGLVLPNLLWLKAQAARHELEKALGISKGLGWCAAAQGRHVWGSGARGSMPALSQKSFRLQPELISDILSPVSFRSLALFIFSSFSCLARKLLKPSEFCQGATL